MVSDDDVEMEFVYELRSDCSGMTRPVSRARVQLLPMTDEPAVVVSPVGTVMVPVATLANVLAPEKYGMLPMTAEVEVERPLNPRVAPVRVIGQVAEMVDCLELNVFQLADDSRPRTSEPFWVGMFSV